MLLLLWNSYHLAHITRGFVCPFFFFFTGSRYKQIDKCLSHKTCDSLFLNRHPRITSIWLNWQAHSAGDVCRFQVNYKCWDPICSLLIHFIVLVANPPPPHFEFYFRILKEFNIDEYFWILLHHEKLIGFACICAQGIIE